MKDSEKKYKKIDPWKLIEDTFHLDNYIDLSVKILSWPFSLFKADTPPFAKNDTKIKVMFSLISIDKGYEDLSDREL